MLAARLSSVLLISMVVGPAVAVRGHDVSHFSASLKAVDTMCSQTDYKQTCLDSLTSIRGSDTSNPKELIKLAFSVTMEKVRDVMNHSQTLQEAKHDPMTAKALQNCEKLLDSAIDDLQSSLDNVVEGFDVSKIGNIVKDIRIWLSGALTFQETCLDGLKARSHAAKSMRHVMKTSAEMTSNALAMVDGISNILPKLDISGIFGHRHLLRADGGSDDPEHNLGAPEWLFSPAGRRLMDTDGGEDHPEHDLGGPDWVFSAKDRRRLLQAPVDEMKPNVVVAQDGSGDYRTINEALKAVPIKSNTHFIIYIKEGLYKEVVTVEKTMTNLVMVGDGPTKTRISGNLNFIDGTPTFQSATLAVVGQNFTGKNFGVENTAGPEKHQAVALRVQGDMSVFFNCQFDAYQDTLYAHTHRQFFRDCVISGTIDFIFGNSAVVFQNCLMLVRKPMDNQQNIVTAQGRKDRREPTGIVLHNCTISADPALEPVKANIRSYLGRPWKEFSRTFILQSQIDDFIHPDGWLPWNGDFALATLFYSEFDNRGPGSVTTRRVTWEGIKKINAKDAEQYTVKAFVEGDRWINPTGVPYTPGLLPLSSAP